MYRLAQTFVFKRSKTSIHKLDPRVRLLIAGQLLILVGASSEVHEVFLTLAVVISLAALARGLRRLANPFFMVWLIIGGTMIFALQFLLNESLVSAVILSTRFIGILLSLSIFYVIISPDEVEQIMKSARLPRDLVFAFSAALRFVPVLILDALRIMDAQRSRGLELDKGWPSTRIKNFVPLLVPFIVTALVRSGELAEAMEARAYGAIPNPSSLEILRLQRIDLLALCLSLVIFSFGLQAFLFV